MTPPPLLGMRSCNLPPRVAEPPGKAESGERKWVNLKTKSLSKEEQGGFSQGWVPTAQPRLRQKVTSCGRIRHCRSKVSMALAMS